ncbi:uncharacterized protein LOC120506873 isoform X3 [Passer montanus]|uniref:uncharacterized protein LOC120506873 isoform X3 n=1 Tax=Passer montanus TaxID=9160 RepID=UPI00195F9EBA|nr:uncharacterized protein LOC120506873 isoform X3 [Passer montanus]
MLVTSYSFSRSCTMTSALRTCLVHREEVFCVWAILGEEMCLNHLSTSPCPPAFAGPSTAASLSHCRNRSGNLERNLWTASNEMEARADESFEVFSSGRSSVSFGGGTRICSFVAQYFVPVTARGLAITPDHV